MTEYTYPGNGPTYGLVLNAGDVATVNSGGAEDATVNDGGKLFSEGGSSYGIQVNAGGFVQVDAGHVDGIALLGGATEVVNGGESASPFVNGGTLTVNAGGTVAQVNVTNGGVEYLHGSNIASTAYDGGRIVLDQPGYVGDQITPGTMTNSLGSLTINTGGTLEIRNGLTDAGLQLNGGTIVIDALPYDDTARGSYDSQTALLTITDAAGTFHVGVANPSGTGGFVLSRDAGSGNVAVMAVPVPVCFCRGSLIATPRGDVAVEQVRVGDDVLTYDGGVARVRWVGRAIVDGGAASRPILVRAGALAPGIPYRDLRVTPGHSFLFGSVLIPIGELVNGCSIVRDTAPGHWEVFHIELDRHDILLANGAAAESYRDDGNRLAFEPGDGRAAPGPMPPCAPVLTSGPVVDAVWASLLPPEAGAAGGMTDDPDLHLIAGGRRIEPYERDGDLFRFLIDENHEDLRLVSRHVVPADVGQARDRRRLGVAFRRASAETARGRHVLGYDAATLVAGFHEAEHEAAMRWTDGDAVLPGFALPGGGPMVLTVELGCRTSYRVG